MNNLFLCATCLVGVSMTAIAEITVDSESAKPLPSGVIESEGGSGGGGAGNIRWFRYMGSEPAYRRDVGQIFVADSKIVFNRLVLRIAHIDGAVGSAAPSADFSIRVYALESPENWSSQKLVAEQSGTLPEKMTPDDRLAFKMDPVSLEPGAYLVTLTFETPSAERYINFSTVSAQSYTAGTGIISTGNEGEAEMNCAPIKGNLAFSLLAP